MKRPFGRWLIAVILLEALAGCAKHDARTGTAQGEDRSLDRVTQADVLLWGADVVGGVPYVYVDPQNPDKYTGFEMEIAQGIAKSLGVELKLVVRAWDTLIPELQRESFDIAMNGIEDTEDRHRMVLFSEPYYVYSQQMTVRRGTAGVTSLADMAGRKVATLSGSAAEDLLRQTPGIEVVITPEITYSYKALEDGEVDAVLLDKPIAAAYGATNPKLENVGPSIGDGRYVISLRRNDRKLLAAVNAALNAMKADGTLKAIYERYGIMDDHQAAIGIL